MMSETASLKNIINELDFLMITVIINEMLEKKKFVVACKQINRTLLITLYIVVQEKVKIL